MIAKISVDNQTINSFIQQLTCHGSRSPPTTDNIAPLYHQSEANDLIIYILDRL